ncbi:MAG: hypothetical protein KF768_08055 [Phycisphaeraceae bacterium]|nr:hypothetical protein [Phycisphaeraceae bacterium]
MNTLHRAHPHRRARTIALSIAALVAAISLGGCVLGQLIGGMAASSERTGTRDVKAKYTGLQNNTFAFIIAADRIVQSEHPDMVVLATREISRRLEQNAGASGILPADEILRFQFQNPAWIMMPHGELAEKLAVDRLVMLELTEFALNEPGNQYIWNGVAAGVVTVIDPSQHFGGEQVFRESVSVRFPDQDGISAEQVPGQAVAQALVRRLSERVAWMFYDHEEPKAIKY